VKRLLGDVLGDVTDALVVALAVVALAAVAGVLLLRGALR